MGLDVDDVLELIGLERKRSFLGAFLPTVGLLALGAAVGAGIGLAFAPSSGRNLREVVGGKLDKIRERVNAETESRMRPAVSANSHHA
jgi:gas vesicle protein